MSKQIDISARLSNKRPTLKLSDDMIYEVNNRKSTMLILNQKMKNTDLNDIAEVDEILTVLLGKKAVREINEMDPSLAGFQAIMMGAMAAVMDEDLEVVEKRFQQSAEAE
ncbi:hypothetical protein [Sporosarcina sp. USHLN248]|uniref:hypothetical protein n=1 Tax=Sporosarcina sp. USHLN248 TaxID=3081300 RepID=UPI003017ACBD